MGAKSDFEQEEAHQLNRSAVPSALVLGLAMKKGGWSLRQLVLSWRKRASAAICWRALVLLARAVRVSSYEV